MNKGTIEKQHRVHEQTIVDRRGIVEQLKAKAAERRAAAAAADAAEREAHAARLTALDDALHLNRVQAEEERRNRAQEWDEVLAERRRRERAREREREFRKMKEEQAELTHQRVVEHEWAAERARMDALAAARERMRLIEQGDLSRLREKRYRELMAAKQEFMDHAAVIGDLISSQLGTTSHLGLLCSLADEKGHTEGRSFGGLRRLLGATLRETHLSPQAGDPGLEGLLRGVPTCDKEVQTLKGATKGGGGKRGGSAGKK